VEEEREMSEIAVPPPPSSLLARLPACCSGDGGGEDRRRWVELGGLNGSRPCHPEEDDAGVQKKRGQAIPWGCLSSNFSESEFRAEVKKK
jgi:hypothetical protein